MARFTVDPARLNFSTERKGKEYNLRVLQRAQSIFSTLLSLLPSNYTSTISGPNYTLELKAVAVEIAKIELALEDVSLDLDYTRTRSEFLYGTIGYLCFLNNRLPSLDFDDSEFRQFLLNLIRIYFQGSVPKSIKDAVGLFLTSEFRILENFLLVRQGSAGLDISDQFGFQIDVATGNQFPAEIFDLQSSIRIILDIIRPAHTLFSVRFIFEDDYEPNPPGGGGGGTDTFGRIADSMRWALSNYYYEDYRRYWSGLRDRDRLGVKECHSVIGEAHGTVNVVADGRFRAAFTASGDLEGVFTASASISQSFVSSGAFTIVSAVVSSAAEVSFNTVGTLDSEAEVLSGTSTEQFAVTGDASIITSGSTIVAAPFTSSGSVANADPSGISAISAWLRNTTLSGGISSVTDMLNDNPATQAIAIRQPTGTDYGGMVFADVHTLVWPLIPATNGTSRTGFGFWLKPASISVTELIYANTLGPGQATLRKIQILKRTSGKLCVQVYRIEGSGNAREAATPTGSVTLGAQFVTFEYDSLGATEADRMTITIGGVVQALTFSDIGTPGVITTLNSPTGNALIGGSTIADVPPNAFEGILGANFYAFGSKMEGATQGLLTPEARAFLMAWEPIP